MTRRTIRPVTGWPVVCVLCGLLVAASGAGSAIAASDGNLFSDAGFELSGPGGDAWHLDRGGETEAEFAVERGDAAEGLRCVRVKMGRVREWGAQFGQQVAAGARGRTFTFSVLAQAVAKPVTVDLQIERSGKPYDRAARGGPFTLQPGAWKELHATFTVDKDFPQGWFAYVSCAQADCEFRVDAFRLCEGPYVPHEQRAQAETAANPVGVVRDGDSAVSVTNAFVALKVRRGAPAIDVHIPRQAAAGAGPRLVPSAGGDDPAGEITAVRVVEQRPDRVRLEVAAVSSKGRKLSAQAMIRSGSPVIEVLPGDGMDRLRVEVRSRYAVVPDLLAGDLVVDASTAKADRLRLPPENLAAQLVEGGDSIVACAWRSRAQPAWLTLDGTGALRAVAATEIGAAGGLPLAVAVLAAPRMWQAKAVADLDAVKDVPFDGPVPFRALWRADFRREDGLVDSWKAVIRRSESDWESFGVSFTKPKARTVWTSSRGSFAYPAFVDGDRLSLRRSRFGEGWATAYRGDSEAVAYPFRAIDGSPASARGVFDVLQEALAGTPEDRRLDDWVIRRVPRDRYPATCAVTAEVEEIFAAGEEKAKRTLIDERLEAMNQFVIGIRSRIDEFLAWRTKTADFVAASRAAHPELGPCADEFKAVLDRYDVRFRDLKLDERTPAAAQELIAKVKALVGRDAPDKVEQMKQIGRDTRTVGGNQDHAIGDFRMLARELRQRAGYRMLEADSDAAFEFARGVRERTREVLGCAFGHEGAFTE